MDGNQMSLVFENQVFNRKSGLSGGRMSCTLVTGFLGSGKTTLLKHILDNRQDLRIAVLVNEYANLDIDSVLLNSSHLNAAFNLSSVSLVHGCACCNMNGPFREALQRIVDSKHNFDCLLIETSGLAKPDKFVEELEEVGIHLDVTVAVVDAESLPMILSIDIVKQQLYHADLVLLNKCDLATLGQISDTEDLVEGLAAGVKVVRSQFCKVPLDLVIDVSRTETQPGITEEIIVPGILSHESRPRTIFSGDTIARNTPLGISSINHADDGSLVVGKRQASNDHHGSLEQEESFSSITFESEHPLSLKLFQSIVLQKMRSMRGLLRAKGILWFEEDRESRFIFNWSGIKRLEAVSSGRWESPPKSSLVLIGTDRSELEAINAELSKSAHSQKVTAAYVGDPKGFAKNFSVKVAVDGRFKEPCLVKEPLVIIGLKGSPLRGILESQLNGALMRIVNGKGNIFLTAITSCQDYNLQILFDENSNPDDAWEEIRIAAGLVISKLCKNFCPCRSDLTAHVH